MPWATLHRSLRGSEQLPYLAAISLWPDHRVACFALEGRGKRWHVRERPVDAKTCQRVLVALRHQSLPLGPGLLRPDLCPAEKETLLGCKAADIGRTRLALHGFLKGVISHVEAAQIGDGFARHQLALHVETLLHFVAAELVDDALGALLEILHVGVGPPVLEIAFLVELRALIVEAVRDFVADDRADGPVVDRIVRGLIEEGRLQNTR